MLKFGRGSSQKKDPKKKVFGGSSFESVCGRTSSLVPPFLSKLIEYIICYNLKDEGLFLFIFKNCFTSVIHIQNYHIYQLSLSIYKYTFVQMNNIRIFYLKIILRKITILKDKFAIFMNICILMLLFFYP